MAVLVIGEHDNSELKDATAKVISAAREIGGPVHVLIAGKNCSDVAAEAAAIEGVDKVILAEADIYENRLAEPLAALIVKLMRNYEATLAPATTSGKNVMPRVAALLDVPQISEIISVVDDKTFERPVYAGNAVQTVEADLPKKVITVRTTAFGAAGVGDEPASIETIDPEDDPAISKFVDEKISQSERPELTSARIIISGGRGMQSGDNFVMLDKIADKLGAAVGASRAAVDAGFVPNEYQVGQTGKVVAPDLYIAVGISGAIQHLAGMKDSKVIVAINKDAEAPIFEIADYGLVADLFQAVPELEEELKKAGY
jgi:electron transfer flavoprotein alpha subunit